MDCCKNVRLTLADGVTLKSAVVPQRGRFGINQGRTVFRSNIERWADGLEMAEMCQGGDFSLEKGSWEAPRCIRVYQDTIAVPY